MLHRIAQQLGVRQACSAGAWSAGVLTQKAAGHTSMHRVSSKEETKTKEAQKPQHQRSLIASMHVSSGEEAPR